MKKIVKKVAILCLSVLSLACFSACNSCGGEVEQPKVEIVYTLVEGGYSVSLSKGSPTTEFTVEVPELHDGLPVVEVAEKGFANRMFLVGVSLPSTIKNIGDEAFANTGIKTITLPSSVEKVGKYAFGGCKNINEVILLGEVNDWFNIQFGVGKLADDVIESYGYDLYSSNPLYLGATLKLKNGETINNVDKITVPSSVDKIGVAQFYGFKVNEIVFEEGLTEIGEGAFAFTTNVTKIVLPNSLTKIGASAFNSSSISEIEIGEGVEIIEKDAFYCSDLTSVTIPDSVTKIGMRAFQGCTKLKTVSLGAKVDKINSYTFADSGLIEITIPETVKEIGEFAFVSARSLKTVNFSEGLEKICQNAFAECSAIEKIKLPTSLITVETSIFYACTSLKTLDFGDGIAEIPNQTAHGCTSLVNIRINKKIKYINQSAFASCHAIKNVYYTGTKIEWDNVWIGIDNDELKADAVTIHYMAN